MNQEGGFTLTLPFLLYSYFLYGQTSTAVSLSQITDVIVQDRQSRTSKKGLDIEIIKVLLQNMESVHDCRTMPSPSEYVIFKKSAGENFRTSA